MNGIKFRDETQLISEKNIRRIAEGYAP